MAESSTSDSSSSNSTILSSDDTTDEEPVVRVPRARNNNAIFTPDLQTCSLGSIPLESQLLAPMTSFKVIVGSLPTKFCGNSTNQLTWQGKGRDKNKDQDKRRWVFYCTYHHQCGCGLRIAIFQDKTDGH